MGGCIPPTPHPYLRIPPYSRGGYVLFICPHGSLPQISKKIRKKFLKNILTPPYLNHSQFQKKSRKNLIYEIFNLYLCTLQKKIEYET